MQNLATPVLFSCLRLAYAGLKGQVKILLVLLNTRPRTKKPITCIPSWRVAELANVPADSAKRNLGSRLVSAAASRVYFYEARTSQHHPFQHLLCTLSLLSCGLLRFFAFPFSSSGWCPVLLHWWHPGRWKNVPRTGL
jgi:hypothetical protein